MRSWRCGLGLAVGGAGATMLALSGCGDARRGEALIGPIFLSTHEEARGQEVFMRHCHQCHPGGAAGLGPAINDKPLPGGMIRMQVRQGLGAMPPFPEEQIPDDELDAVVAYLRMMRDAD